MRINVAGCNGTLFTTCSHRNFGTQVGTRPNACGNFALYASSWHDHPHVENLASKYLTHGLGKVLLCELNDGFRTFLKNKKVDVESNEEKCSNKKPVVEVGPAC